MKKLSLVLNLAFMISFSALAQKGFYFDEAKYMPLEDKSETIYITEANGVEFKAKKDKITYRSAYTDEKSRKLKTGLKRSIRLINEFDELKKLRFDGCDIEKAFTGTTNNKDCFKKLYEYKIFANFAHGVESKIKLSYYLAIFPRSTKAKDIKFQIEWFNAGVGSHAQVRADLDHPILLVPQTNLKKLGRVTKKTVFPKDLPETIRDYSNDKNYYGKNGNWKSSISSFETQIIPGSFIYSLNAIRLQGGPEEWSMTSGMFGTFGIALNISSPAHHAQENNSEVLVDQFSLNINQKQKQAIFNKMLNDSDKFKETLIYNSVFNSCVNYAFRALYANGKGVPGLNLSDKYFFNPYRMTPRLVQVGAIESEEATTTSLNDEYGFIGTQRFDPENKSAVELNQKFQPYLPIVTDPAFDHYVLNFAYEVARAELTMTELEELKEVAAKIGEAMGSEAEMYQELLFNGMGAFQPELD